MIKEIATFIATKAGLVIGTTLQVGHRTQDDPDRCSVVMESGGGAIHVDLPDRVDKMVQIISRGLTYFNARDDAMDIYDALYRDHTLGSAGWELTAIAPAIQDYVVMVIEPVSVPAYIGQDEKGRFEFSQNSIWRIRNK